VLSALTVLKSGLEAFVSVVSVRDVSWVVEVKPEATVAVLVSEVSFSPA